MKSPRTLAALLVTAALTASGAGPAPPEARAQARPTGVDVQQFRPGAGASDYLDILGGFAGKHLAVAGGFLLNHATGVLLTDRDGAGAKVDVVDRQTVVDLLASMSFFDTLEFGVAVPLITGLTTGPGWVPTGGDPDEGVQIGDIRLTPKITILNLERAFALAIAAPISLPTGHDFGGYGVFSIEPTLIGDFVPTSYFRMTVNVGGRFRDDATLGDLALGTELLWGLGLKFSFVIADQPFSVVGAFSGSFELPDQEREVPPFEFVAGLEWRGIPGWALTLGAGAGLTRGYGAPDSRVVFGVRYSSYSDCPYGPEDYDHFEDDDGCADPDNDQDGIPDELDLCPNEPETFNGVDDEDGCPDRVLDLPDLKPGDSSRYDSMTEDDDGDGIVNGLDACPGEPEDFDGFLDEDGCPDPDNDGDGVLDADDRCPLLAETPNGFEDSDGCPDEAPPAKVKVDDLARTIEIADVIHFETGKAKISERSSALLDEIASTLLQRSDIAKVRIEGHTDARGPDDFNLRLSQDRANAVVAALVARNVPAARLEAIGFGETKPIADNRTAAGRTKNRRVEFKILAYGEGATP